MTNFITILSHFMVSGTIYYPPSSSFHYRADQCRQLERQQCYRRLGSKQGSNDNDRSVSLSSLSPPNLENPPVKIRHSPRRAQNLSSEYFANNTMMMLNQVYLSKVREELPAFASHVAPL